MAFSPYIVRDGKRYGVDDYAAALFMCVGLALLSAADLAAHAERDTQAAGIMLLVVAVCSDLCGNQPVRRVHPTILH